MAHGAMRCSMRATQGLAISATSIASTQSWMRMASEAMLYDMLRMDLCDWHPKQIYETDALLEQKQLTLSGLDAWVEALLQEGVLPLATDKYPNRSLTRDLAASARKFDPHTNDSEVPRHLEKLLKVSA